MTNSQVRYFYNKETNAVYRIVNNLRITMYYRSKKVFVNERDFEKFL